MRPTYFQNQCNRRRLANANAENHSVRVSGKRGSWFRLLLKAGIRSVQQLRLWDPAELLSHLTDIVEATGLLKRPPTYAEIRELD